MHLRSIILSSLALALACGGDDGGTTATTTENGSTGGSTSHDGSGSSTSHAHGSTSDASTSGSGSGPGSSTGGSTGASTGSDGTTGADTGASTGEASSTGGTTGGVVFSTFSCTETSVVDAAMVETIDGSFDEAGVPMDLVATFTQSGSVDFQVDVAQPVAPGDPHYDEVVYWEDSLTMQGWDVTPPGDPFADHRYFFAPEGAQYVALFSAFYYRVYEAGGNGQFEFECIRL